MVALGDARLACEGGGVAAWVLGASFDGVDLGFAIEVADFGVGCGLDGFLAEGGVSDGVVCVDLGASLGFGGSLG